MNAFGNVAASPFVRSDQSVLSQTIWIALFAAATAVGARVDIPHEPVPFTLQTLFVLLSGAFLGARNGALSQVLYLGMGVLGAPVFSLGGFGIAKLLGPTGGYLLAFPVAAALVGYLIQFRRTLLWSFTSMTAGLVIIFACGTIQLYAVVFKDWATAFNAGFLIFSWWDVLKLSAAAMTYHEIAKRWARVPNG
ncbi:MAG: biotin transporter substrate-specific component [Bacteroidetes bacterium]|nr:biotin transporter substrate-specific component [Bacteroidota bacterium]